MSALDYLVPTFRDPHALLLAPVILAGVWWSARRVAGQAVIFSSVAGLRGLPVTWAQQARRFMPWLRAVGVLLLVVALARPQKGVTETLVRTEGIAIEAALDTSKSMDAQDFYRDRKRVSRMDAVKAVFSEFIGGDKDSKLSGRPNDFIGLVTFGGFADSRCPLTLDHGALLQVVESLDTPQMIRDPKGEIINREMAEQEGATAIGDGLALAIERLKDVEAKSKIVVLLSDGVNNAGVVEPDEAAQAAKTLGIRIYSIGIGSNDAEVPFPIEDRWGRVQLRRVRLPIDEAQLERLATATGGRYYNATSTDALRGVYAEIDKLERTETEQKLYTDYRELFFWPLAVGVGLLLVESLLSATRFRTLP